MYHFLGQEDSSEISIIIIYFTELFIFLKLHKNMNNFKRVEKMITENETMDEWIPLVKLIFNVLLWAHIIAIVFHGLSIY